MRENMVKIELEKYARPYHSEPVGLCKDFGLHSKSNKRKTLKCYQGKTTFCEMIKSMYWEDYFVCSVENMCSKDSEITSRMSFY